MLQKRTSVLEELGVLGLISPCTVMLNILGERKKFNTYYNNVVTLQ